MRLGPVEHEAADRSSRLRCRIDSQRRQQIDQNLLIGIERGVLDAALLPHPATEGGKCRPGLLQRRRPFRWEDAHLTQIGDEQCGSALRRAGGLAPSEHGGRCGEANGERFDPEAGRACTDRLKMNGTTGRK